MPRRKQTRRSRTVKITVILRTGEELVGWILTAALRAIEHGEFPFPSFSFWPSAQSTDRESLANDITVSSVAEVCA